MTEKYRSHASGGDDYPFFAQFVGRSQLTVGRKLHRDAQCSLFHRFRHPVLEQRLLPGYLVEGRLTTGLVEFLVPVEGVPAVTHDMAGMGNMAQLPGQLQEAQLGLQ